MTNPDHCFVSCPSGRLEGVVVDGIHEFRGVPFACPPVGPLRFKAPQPVMPWQGTYQATGFPAASLQEKNPLMGINEISEDCLYLNIWRPDTITDGPLPVMVWIHGGGYQSGSPSQRMYSGRELARKHNVIVVNLSYRLGFLGFNWLHEVAPELEADANAGILDQIAGLEWVRDNIAAFGGDPDRVTLFGESAGGFSIGTLLAIPRAASLFHRAIVQSGSADFVVSTEEASRVARAVVEALPGEGSAAEKLRNASEQALVRAQRVVYGLSVQRGLRTTTPQYAMTTMPVVDGALITDVPCHLIAQGSARGKQVIAGVCRDEWHLFLYAPPFNGGHTLAQLKQQPEGEAHRRILRGLPQQGEAAWSLYRSQVQPDPRRGPLDIFSAVESDRLFRVPTVRLLDALVKGGAEAWAYEFTWEIDAFGVPLGACHVSDIPFTFGGLNSPVGQLFSGGGGEQAQALVDTVQRRWTRFARGEGTDWASWQASRQAVELGADTVTGMRTLLSEEQEALWDTIIPAVS